MTHDSRWTRRDFLSTTAIGVVGLAAQKVAQRPEERMAFVGTYTNDRRSEGIYRVFLNTATGTLRYGGLAAKAVNTSYLAVHPNGRVLYAVNEVSDFGGQETGAVSAYAIDRVTRGLHFLNQQQSHGKAPCYVSVDRTGHIVLVANYGGGSIATIPIGADGRLDAPKSVMKHAGKSIDPVRQTVPHAHCIVADPTNRFAIAVDLGIDAVLSYRFDERTGSLAPVTPGTAAKPGAGPRHLTFHPNGRFAYLVNELDSTLSVLTYDGERGALTEIQVTAASPNGTVAENHPADIHVASSGRHVYVSNRGDDTIAVFVIDPSSGQVTPVQQISSGGKSPRNFSLDPTGRFLVAANQRSDAIVSFRVDGESGRLTPTGSTLEIALPVCVRWV
jgi:6-phosphogluconolactonase